MTAVQEMAPFGDMVRRYRRALELTQEELAEQAGLSERAVRAIESGGKHLPRKETVQLLADALKLTGEEREAFQSTARRVGESEGSGLGTASTRTNLPDEPTPFIGRERELGELSDLLRRPAVRLVTLTGPGGAGKTRLALQVAAHLVPHFKDGVFLVSLASLSDPDLVLSAIAATVGVQEGKGASVLDALMASLHTRHLLLVLDNVEHLLDAAPRIGELLAACRGLHLLATSRIPLHLAREHEYAVPPLSVPASDQLPALEELRQYDAVALFLERAQAIRADFGLTAANASAVVEICRRLDGLPLAIVLVAARIKIFPPAALQHRLSSGLTLLTGGANDRPARHQTLRAAVDWSYGLLSEEEKVLFARISVFTGGCTLEAAEAVCAAEGDRELEVLDGVTSLVEKSLLQQEGEEEPHFRMLETIREYALERLAESGAEERLKRQHARYFLGLAEEAAPQLQAVNRLQWLNRLTEEHDNLRAALTWLHEHGEVEPALRLAVALSRFWEIRGYLAEGRGWLKALLPASETAPPSLRAAALFAAGELAAALGNGEEATDLLEVSLALYRQVGDVQSSAEVIDRFAYSCLLWQGVSRWVSTVEEHLTLGREIGDKLLVATSLHWLAWVAAGDNNPRRARLLGEESLALYRNLGDMKHAVDALLVLMAAAYLEGDVQTAGAWCEEIVAQLPRLGLGASTFPRMQMGAFYARNRGDYEHALRLLEGMEARALEVGDRRNAAYVRNVLALLTREQGGYERARALYQESLRVFQEVGDRYGIGNTLLGLGDVARDLGQAEDAISPCRQALELGREMGDRVSTAYALHNLALAARARGQYPRAEALLEESLAIVADQPACKVEILASAALVALDQGRHDRVEEAFIESLLSADTARPGWVSGTLLEAMAGAAVGRGQPEHAARLFGAAAAIRTRTGTPIPPVNRPRYDRDVAAVGTALEAEPFHALWNEGQAMTEDQAIAQALERVSPPVP